MEIVSADEAQALFPPMSTDGVLAAAYIADDGYLDPSQLTFSLAEGARRLGAQIEVRTRVTGIETRDGRVVAVETDQGRIECEVVVDAAGMYAPEIARLVGVDLPIIPFGHQYLVTEPFEPALEPLPTLRDPDNLIYFRTEVGGLVMGGYERTPASWGLDGIPEGFEAKLLPEDWDRMQQLFVNAIHRVPAMEHAEVKMFFNGPEAFTPDADFLLGETDVPGFWVAAGGCAHGLAGAGGVGKVMSEWIVDGRPEWDVWPLDLRRFGRQYRSQAYTLARTVEALSQYYDIKYPGEEKKAGRPLRVSPAYARHAALGAAFGEKGGWERVNWYESNAAGGDESLRPRGWAGENWSPAIEVEARAARESVALFDQSSFSKLEVLGPGALAFLERMCANRIDRPVGTVVYTQLLNARGGIEADVSVMRRADDRFLFVTGTAFGTHDRAWLEKNMPRDGSVYVNDVTSAYACLCLWGPKARDVVDLDFPYMQAREISLGNVPVIASRVTYVGELGWEFYCPAEYGLALWDTALRRRRHAGRLPGDRRAAAREGLPRVGERPQRRDVAVRGGARLRGEARQGRVHRPRRARPGAGAAARLSRARGSACDRARLGAGARCGRDDRRPRHERRLRLRGRREHRVRVRPRRVHGAGDGDGRRHLRRLDRGRGSGRTVVRPQGRTGEGMKYARIMAEVEESIASGCLAPGDRLPTERDLAADYGVSRMTVRQALQSLEARGVLRRTIGRNGGSFVAQPKLERDLGTFSGLSAELARQGVAPGARVLSAREAWPSIEIVRVRYADGDPFALERSSFPAERFQGLLDLDLTGSLYELLDEHFDAAPVRAVERIEPVLADAAGGGGARREPARAADARRSRCVRRRRRDGRDGARRLPRRPHADRRLDVGARRAVTTVVVGGGIAGVSCAYHLAKAGVKDVVLVEKGELTSGSTHHAAGLVTQFNPSPTMMRFRRYSVELYKELGVFEAVGSLRIASSPESFAELKRGVSRARGIGLDAELVGPEEVRRLPVGGVTGVALRCGVDAGRRLRRPAHRDVRGRVGCA